MRHRFESRARVSQVPESRASLEIDVPASASPRTVPLSALASSVSDEVGPVECAGDATISGVTHDSRLVRPGWLFLAMAGSRTDGSAYAASAVQAGATALAVEHFLDLPVAQLKVSSVRRAAGPLSAAFHGRPSEALAVVGVTGTNGKTTTCELVRACCEAHSGPAGQIGTVGTHIGAAFFPASLTTPEATELQDIFADMVAAGVRHVAMEVSSHGLDQHRIDGTRFALAVFLNLTPEHLEYHGTMERYLEAKARLFDPGRAQRGLVCIDDRWGERLARSAEIPLTTYGRSRSADVVYSGTGYGLDGITVRLRGIDGGVELRSPLVGTVNAPNVAAAYLSARLLGIDPDTAADAIARCAAPPGRFEVVTTDEPFIVAVDYAHTPDALAALLDTAHALAAPGGGVAVVLGARGGRYRGKRPTMGAIAARAARVVFTTDSPGDEDPRAILAHLLDGARTVPGAQIAVELDRRLAIAKAVNQAAPGDVVVLTGRGHETTQRFGDARVELDDREAARAALSARAGRGPAVGPAVGPVGGAPNGATTGAGPATVSVVIPAHDAAGSLGRALSSVLAQTKPPEEIIVVDDGSKDATAAVAGSFGPRVRVLSRTCGGPSAARNAGIDAATGRFVAFLDADDEWHPDKLAAQLEVLGRRPEAVLVATDWSRELTDDVPGSTDESDWTTRDLMVLNRFQTSTVLLERGVALSAGGFDPAADGAEDWDLWLRASRHGAVVKIDRPLVAYTDRPEGYSKDLRRHYDAAMGMLARASASEVSRDLRTIRAWHHLRYAIAFALIGQRAEALRCVAHVGTEGLVGRVPAATSRHLVPFLLGRVRRRARRRR